jgi:hypothetical protein
LDAEQCGREGFDIRISRLEREVLDDVEGARTTCSLAR